MCGREALIKEFARAWAAKDVEGLMRLMADRCEFRTSVGPGPGAVYLGHDEVSRAFGAFLAPSGGSEPGTVEEVFVEEVFLADETDLFADDFAVTRSTTRTVHPDGSAVLTRICDVFEFENDLIRVKDTYRKLIGPAPA